MRLRTEPENDGVCRPRARGHEAFGDFQHAGDLHGIGPGRVIHHGRPAMFGAVQHRLQAVRVAAGRGLRRQTEARELVPTVRVRSIEAIGEFSGRYAATLLGAREVATAIATSGPIHLAIVKKGSAQ